MRSRLHACAELASMAAKLLALVHAHDEVAGSAESMQAAALQFEGLLQARTRGPTSETLADHVHRTC